MQVQRNVVVQLICGRQLASSKHQCTAVYVTTFYMLQYMSVGTDKVEDVKTIGENGPKNRFLLKLSFLKTHSSLSVTLYSCLHTEYIYHT
jgi:hypothetical protein